MSAHSERDRAPRDPAPGDQTSQQRFPDDRRPAGGQAPDMAAWLDYFEANASAADPLSWGIEETLTSRERRTISSSIAKFQLGEYSEGHSLKAFAEAFADELGDRYLVPITRFFIKEEQKHAQLLKRFMERHELALSRKSWTDTVFRRLRKRAGYELSITVLITAELIALVYYRALRASTASTVLAEICTLILAEEDAHTRYESELLRYLRARRTGWTRSLPGALHRFLYAGTVLVVYLDHRRVLARGGYGLFAFWSACWLVFDRSFPRGGAPVASSGPPGDRETRRAS